MSVCACLCLVFEEFMALRDEHLHSLSLLGKLLHSHDSCTVGRAHDGGSKDDREVLGIHLVGRLQHLHPERGRESSVDTQEVIVAEIETQLVKTGSPLTSLSIPYYHRSHCHPPPTTGIPARETHL